MEVDKQLKFKSHQRMQVEFISNNVDVMTHDFLSCVGKPTVVVQCNGDLVEVATFSGNYVVVKKIIPGDNVQLELSVITSRLEHINPRAFNIRRLFRLRRKIDATLATAFATIRSWVLASVP